MKDFFNKIPRIGLSSETARYEDLPDEVLRRTLGGEVAIERRIKCRELS